MVARTNSLGVSSAGLLAAAKAVKLPTRAGLLAAAKAVELAGPIDAPAKMTFGEQVVEAFGEFVDAKLDYDRARHGPAADYVNSDPVYKAGERLQELLDRVRHE